MASSARFLIFSTEASRASASNSRARMTISDSAAIAATPAASQPSQSARANRSRISRSVHRPIASETSVPSAPRKIAPSRERRRGAIAGGGSLVSTSSSSKTSISAGMTIATSDLAMARGLRARLGVSLRLAVRRLRLGLRLDAERCGSARFAHASLSPIRNCSARSSLICGSDSDDALGRALDLRRPEPHETDRRLVRGLLRVTDSHCSKTESGFLRQVAGKYSGFGLAVEFFLADRLAVERRADDHRQASRGLA